MSTESRYLAARMRDAANTLAEANKVYGFSPEYGVWSPGPHRNGDGRAAGGWGVWGRRGC